MPPTATPITDPDRGFSEEFALTRGGKRGQRNYLVDTDRADLAVFADGLPRQGDIWSAEHADLVVTQVGPIARMGGKDSGGGLGAYSRVPVLYETPTAASFRPASPDDAYTEIELAAGTETQVFPIERQGADLVIPCRGGDGESIVKITMRSRVHTFHDFQDPLPVLGWIARCSPKPRLNNGPLRFPKVFGGQARFQVGEGQALYLGFEQPERVQGTAMIRVVHVFDLAEDFWVEWQRSNAEGMAVGPVIRDRFYDYAAFGDLWPGA